MGAGDRGKGLVNGQSSLRTFLKISAILPGLKLKFPCGVLEICKKKRKKWPP